MRLGKYADLSPLIAFVFVIGIVFLFDRERGDAAEREVENHTRSAERRARTLADMLNNEMAARMGSLETLKSSFTTVRDEVSERTFAIALDSAATRMPGLTSIAVIYPEDERILKPPGAGIGRLITLEDTLLRHAYLRAVYNRETSATNTVDYGVGRRVFLFDPLLSSDSSQVIAVLAAELEPGALYRNASNAAARADSLDVGAGIGTLYGPDGIRLSGFQNIPPSWTSVTQPVRVGDTFWVVEWAYPRAEVDVYRAQRLAMWIVGLVVALAIAVILHFLRRTIRTQNEEIARRQAAEEAARTAAADARERAKEARDLTTQLEAAQRASQRLSTSLNPDDVVELFLGGVAEILEADVASLYTFEEEGEVLVGRRRMVFRDVEGVTERLRTEDIGQVRAPVALLPGLGEAVSTGEPYVVEDSSDDARLLPGRATGPESAAASVTVPLLIAGHTVGVASWEVYSGPRRFPPAIIAFAQALAAPAAAALRTAELFLSLEDERRRASREALRFGAVLDQMADGVIVVDSNGKLERSNQAAVELVNDELAAAPVEEWPAKFDLVSIEGRPFTPAEFPLMRAMRGERVRRAAFIVRSDWGTERHLSGSAGPILTQDGKPAGAAMVLRDVTDEHQYAEMLRHTNRELRRQADVLEQVNQQLREATKAKDQFLAVMSHELRTPINAIMGYSDLLDLGVKGALNDDQRAMLSRVRETSRHLLGLINEVLDLAKIGAGRMDLVTLELNAGELIERAAQQILPLAVSKGLQLEVMPPADNAPVLVHADETRLMQIIVNLLSNAVKFTAQGGIRVKYWDEDGRVTISVEDSGPGIPPDQVERIFEEFYQVEGGLSRASGGTGLGLAIARRFARLMDGEIRVESEVGQGSVFSIILPGAEGMATEEAAPSELRVVLLARSQAAVSRTRGDLADEIHVSGVTEPTQVATLARRERPSLVAIDVRVPDFGAWRALMSLQAEPSTAGLPALLYAHEDDHGEVALDIGLVTVLTKPISIDAVRDVVLGHGVPRGPSILIADDDPDVRRILGETLNAEGCAVRTASSGGETLDMARRMMPDVAVIDLLMPGMDGIEAIAMMRAEPGLQHVRVVALVSRELVDDEMERLSAAIEALGRGHRARPVATAALIRSSVEAAEARRASTGSVA